MGSLHLAALESDPLWGGVGEVFSQNRVCNSFGAITGASNIGWAAVLVSERPHR